MNFFEKKFSFWRLNIPLRLTASALIILAAKLAGAFAVSQILNLPAAGTFWVGNQAVNGVQNQVLQSVNSGGTALFLGWDSSWYLSILTYGYSFSAQSYAFFPGFPLISGFLNMIFQNNAFSLSICSLIFGVLCVPAYQLVAELYLSRPAAFLSTLLFMFSPYVFLFTTVAYSESIMLFFVLLTWLFFKKGRTGLASLSASIAVISRTVGILIIIPMTIETLFRKEPHKKRGLILCFLPVLALLVWLLYSQINAGDWLAFLHTTEWSSMYSFREMVLYILPQIGLQGYMPPGTMHLFVPLTAWICVVVPPFLIAGLSKTSKSLTVYASVYFLGVLAFGAMISLPRFMSILFPLWVALMSRFVVNRMSVVMLCGVFAVFYVYGLFLWINFLNGVFVG